jgi:hypothetical protein
MSSGRFQYESKDNFVKSAAQPLDDLPVSGMMTLSPRSQMDLNIQNTGNYNPGDLKHATVVIKPSHKVAALKEKDSKSRKMTAQSNMSKKDK